MVQLTKQLTEGKIWAKKSSTINRETKKTIL
jgi:hypothetical protein